MHDCVTCGCACYCHGDIDDCVVESMEYAYEHCEGCGCLEDGLEPFADDDEDPLPTASYLREQEARRQQIARESAGQLRLLP